MPIYDLECPACGLIQRDQLLRREDHPPCPQDGTLMRYRWDVFPGVIDDQLPGGPQWIENLGHRPVYVETKSQLRDEAAARGLQPFVRHTPPDPGSDKAKETSRWL